MGMDTSALSAVKWSNLKGRAVERKSKDTKRCPRCLFRLESGRCPRCDWPGCKIPDHWTDDEWKEYIKKRRERKRKQTIKKKAITVVKEAIEKGLLVRPKKCTFCGSTGKIEAHHWSYKPEYWLDVIWLCLPCHRKEHSKGGITRNRIIESLDSEYHNDLSKPKYRKNPKKFWEEQFILRKKDRAKLKRRCTMLSKEAQIVFNWKDWKKTITKHFTKFEIDKKEIDWESIKRHYEEAKKELKMDLELAKREFEINEEFLEKAIIELAKFQGGNYA